LNYLDQKRFKLLQHFIPQGASVFFRSRRLGECVAESFKTNTVDQYEEGRGDVGADAGKQYDCLILDQVIGHVEDVQQLLIDHHALAHSRTQLVLTLSNGLYRLLPRKLNKGGASHNWLAVDDVKNLLELSGWEEVFTCHEQSFPFKIPFLSAFLERYILRLPLLEYFASTIVLIARPKVERSEGQELPSCSIVVPVRNESGHIAAALERIPVLGGHTEVIFVEGNSKDDTWEVLQLACKEYDGPLELKYLQQPGIGKWDAVQAGFAVATGDLFVIQDGDLTAPPEDLPKFYNAVVNGDADFANGSRLIYPMESEAMRFLNLLGNKFFALSLSWILRQKIKDSLCGTKMLRREDYERVRAVVKERLGDFDPFGDFTLLFGSAMLGLKMRDIPVRYKDRAYGTTNISRFQHGVILFKMTWFALWRIRFFKY